MTFEEVKNEYLLRIGQPESAGSSREEMAEHLRRIRKAYNELCRTTMSTWVEPTLVSLSAVTITTNEHDLDTILDLAAGDGIYSVDKVFWAARPRPRLPNWNKQAIEEHNRRYSAVTLTYPSAYAVWEERDTTTPADVWKISFAPYIYAADTTNCYISYFRKPPQPALINIDGTMAMYPQFSDDFHEVIAELAALKYLRDRGDGRWSQSRWIDVQDEIKTMKDRYTPMVTKGEAFAGFLQGGARFGTLRYGEEVND